MTTETTETSIPAGYVFACDLAEIPLRGKKSIEVNGVRVLLVASDKGLYAVEDRCPQTGASIAHGEVLGVTMTLPTNGARYSLVTGRYLGGGQSWLSSHWLSIWPLMVIDNNVYVRPLTD